jgi:hypothetical protein
MGTFTLPLKRVIELTGGTTALVNGETKLTGGNIGLQHYPIFDPTYRDSLNGRIVDRYWNREIGLETVDMFQLAMRRKMNEIMPYYNKLYLSERVAYDPLSTVDLTTSSNANVTQDSTSNGDSTTTGNATGKSRSVSSETPQTALSGNGDYATAASDVNSDSSNDSTGSQTSVDNATTATDATNHTTGYQGAASDLIMRYRESLLNIDLMILGELEELFMLVWDNGDEYTARSTMRGIY